MTVRKGKYFSPDGTSYEERALPPFMENTPYVRYEVVVPLEVESGKTAPWFDQKGLGKQYLTELDLEKLIDDGYIKELK